MQQEPPKRQTKKQYATPNLKEYGIVHELTQSGSGSRDMRRGMSMGMSMSMGMGMGLGMRW